MMPRPLPTLVAIAVLLVGSILGSGDAQAACPPPSRAYVLTGDDSGFLTEGYATSSANEAESDFEDAGYEVVRKDEATKQDFIDALNDPCTRAIWVFGHGKYDTKTGLLGKEKLGDPVPMIDMTDLAVEPDDVNGPANDKKYPNIKQVTFHSCGQDLQGWRELFPGATFNGWSSTTRGWQIYWWQFFHTYPAINPNTGNETASLPPHEPPVLASSLEQTGQYSYEASVDKYLCDMSPVANDCLMGSPTKEAFGEQVFGVVTDGSVQPPITVFDAVVQDGCIVAVDISGTSPRNFYVTMTDDALRAILEDPSQFYPQVDAGEVQLYVIASTASSSTLLEGFRQVLFGEPTPPAVPALSNVGLWGAVGLVAFLGVVAIRADWRKSPPQA